MQPQDNAAPGAGSNILLDENSGASGTYADWVDCFRAAWARPDADPGPLLALLAPDVTLSAPGFRTTRGRAAARRAFERAFRALPDLRADILDWAARDGTVFIEMVFSASIGNRRVEWRNVDRFRFENGLAVERVAVFDPSPVRKAYLSSIGGIVSLLRFRLSRMLRLAND